MQKKRTVGIVVSLLMVLPAISLYSAGRQERTVGDEGKTTVVFQNFLSAEQAFQPVIEEMVAMFESQNEGIEIEIRPLPYEQTLQQTIISGSSGNMADVVMLVPSWTPPLVELGVLSPLDGLFPTVFFDDIPRAAHKSGVIDGQTYTLPALLNVVMVWAWKPLLIEAGLDPVVPETWGEFRRASQRLAAASDSSTFGFAARTDGTQNSAYWMFPVIWGYGGNFVNDNEEVVLGHGTAYADSLRWYYDLVASRQSPNAMGVRELRNVFAQGRIGFLLDVSNAIATFRRVSERGTGIDDDIVVGLMPKAPDGQRYGIGNDNVYAIAEGSAVKDAAARFIEFMTSDPDATRLLYERTGSFPTRRSLYNDPAYQAQPFFAEIAEMAEFATSLPSKRPEFGNALDIMANALQAAILGGNPETIARETAASVSEIYK